MVLKWSETVGKLQPTWHKVHVPFSLLVPDISSSGKVSCLQLISTSNKYHIYSCISRTFVTIIISKNLRLTYSTELSLVTKPTIIIIIIIIIWLAGTEDCVDGSMQGIEVYIEKREERRIKTARKSNGNRKTNK